MLSAQNDAIAPETIRVGPLTMRFLAPGAPSTASVTAFEMAVPPNGFHPEAHSHVDADELVVGIEGELTYEADGRHYVLRAGDSAFCPHGAVHQFRNEGSTTARALFVLTPGTIGIGYFREVAALVSAGPPDREKMRAVMTRHGLTPA
jgi:quercetin dioxygenase-like cupin family protein